MKLLYGVQGTGNGHIARARIMAAALAERDDISVDFVFTGRAPERYFDMDVFGQYRTYTGLSFILRISFVLLPIILSALIYFSLIYQFSKELKTK